MRPEYLCAWLGLVLSTAACAGAPVLVKRSDLTLTLGRDHELTGRIWSQAKQKFVARQTLFNALGRAHFVLLGETHDNADHHRLQATLLEHWLDTHARAAVAFEMLEEEQTAALHERAPKDADELGERVQWAAHGWPPYGLYRPIFATVLEHGARILAAQPDRDHLLASMHVPQGDAEASLQLSPAFSQPIRDAMTAEIREAHCGHAPDAMIEPMLRAQSYRDAFMARVLAQAGGAAALIAGRGHVRKDRAVPAFLARHGAKEVLSVAFVDVEDESDRATDYDIGAFDFVVFTPRVSDESACDRFKRELAHMREKKR